MKLGKKPARPDAVKFKLSAYLNTAALPLGSTAHKRFLQAAGAGYGREDDLRNSRLAGFDHHLIKPVNVDLLLKLLALPSDMEVDVTDL